MSLPSIFELAQKHGLNIANMTPEERADLLLKAIREDMPEAVEYLHNLAHQAQKTGETVSWLEDPKSKLGGQLIRIHASDAMRPLVEEHICHGLSLTFVNCCGGSVGKKKKTIEEVIEMQIAAQSGDIAKPDC